MTRHRLNAISGALLVILTISGTTRAGTVFSVDLTGSQEVPPNTSVNAGTATLELSDDESTLSYTIDVQKFEFNSITGLHIHNAAADANGPIVFGMINPYHDNNDLEVDYTAADGRYVFTGKWDSSDTGADSLANQLANLKNGLLYINLHTPAFPGGEIRGQIVPEPSAGLLVATAFGSLLLTRRRRNR